MSLFNIYKTLCDGLGLAPVNGSYVQALGDYFGVVDNPNRRYEDEVLVQALINSGGPGTSEVLIFDTFASFPATGIPTSLYVAKDANVIYRWDDVLNTYAILNDPDVVNPDAPEEGQTFYVRLATTTRLNTCTYNNGTAGVGATLTATANGVLAEIQFVGKIDNIAAALGDVILVKNQTSALQNGVYEVTQLGSVSAPFILTRIDGYNETDEVYPSVVFVSQGSNNANRYFTQSTSNPVIGTNNLVYAVATTAQPALPILFCDTVTQGPLDSFDAFPATYTSGTTYASLPGWGATLRGNVNGALGVINGVTMTSGRRIIVKDEINAAYNGSYTVTNAGSATQRWVLTRWVTDSSQWYTGREFVVTNPSCNDFGSRWSVSSPLSMSNLNYGITPIVWAKQNKLSNILSSTADQNSNVMLDTQHIYSEDFFGELKMGWDYGTGKECYLYRAQDGSGEARVGLYTDGKGLVAHDSLDGVSNRITMFSNSAIWIKNGNSINIPQDGDLLIINELTGSTNLQGLNGVYISDTSDTNYVDIDALNNKIEIASDKINLEPTTGVYLNNYGILYGGSDGGFEFTTNRLYLGDASNADTTWSLGNAAGASIQYDATDIIYQCTTGVIQIISSVDNIILNGSSTGLPVYANDAAADADTSLLPGALYKVTGNRTVFQKP